jgi:hypothetical protein
MRLDVNGEMLIDAPFDVVSSANQIVNRPPNAIKTHLDPAVPKPTDVVFCRVDTDLYRRDPDYDIVRYRYQWRVNGTLVRDVVSVVLSDALPRSVVPVGGILSCAVTPSDGLSDGQADSVQRNINFAGAPVDFDKDGKSDVAIYRDGVWAIRRSSDIGTTVIGLGGAADIPVPADYDGDGTTDEAIYLNGLWTIKRSSDSAVITTSFGAPSFTPVPADYDGDGKADTAIYSNGVWSILRSSDGGNTVVGWGGPGSSRSLPIMTATAKPISPSTPTASGQLSVRRMEAIRLWAGADPHSFRFQRTTTAMVKPISPSTSMGYGRSCAHRTEAIALLVGVALRSRPYRRIMTATVKPTLPSTTQAAFGRSSDRRMEPTRSSDGAAQLRMFQ